MAKRKAKTQKKPVHVEIKDEELERFAGSSDSDPDDDGEDDQLDEIVEEPNSPDNDHAKTSANENNDDNDDDDDDDIAQFANGPTGLANAMAKILNTRVTESTTSVILSKTTTPLQRMAKLEKEQAKLALEKRRLNREKKLQAHHVPLSVATTLGPMGTGSDLIKELEMERTHRRVATRGVVALFNAIAQHQKKNDGTTVDSTSTTTSKSKSNVKNMTKHGFLDMIKTAAASDQTSTKNRLDEAGPAKPKWNALKDDFMMGSKLKDWDKESSEEEEEDPVEDNFDEEQPQVEPPKTKRQRA